MVATLINLGSSRHARLAGDVPHMCIEARSRAPREGSLSWPVDQRRKDLSVRPAASSEKRSSLCGLHWKVDFVLVADVSPWLA